MGRVPNVTHPILMQLPARQPFSGTLRPDSSVSVSGWENQADGTTNLHNSVNDQSDATYVRQQIPVISVCPTTENDSIEFGLENPSTTPNGSESVNLRVKARKAFPFGGSGTSTMRIRLRQGTTVISTDSGNGLTTSFAWYDCFLSQAEKNAITDWTNLRALVDADSCAAGAGDEVEVHIAEIGLVVN